MLFSSLTAIITMIGILSKESFTESNKKHDITFILGVLLAIPLILTKSLIAIFASLVGFSLGVYIFVMSDYRKHIAREATIKYFFLSAVSVTLILFSFSLMYAIFETTDTAVIKTTAVENSALTFLAFTFLVCGFSFKLAAYPGQLWAADVYEGSPKPVFAFFVLPSKIIIFIVFLNLLTDVFPALEES